MERQIWMNLPWEVRQRLLIMEKQRIHGIWNMFRAVHQEVPVRQLRQENVHMHLDLIQEVPSVSQVLSVELLESSQPMERYPVMD